MKKLFKVMLALTLSLSLPVSAIGATTAPTQTQQVRLQGDTRYETAVSIANELAKQHEIDFVAGEKFADVVLASGNNFPDALAGAPLANQENAPILLVDSTPEASTATFNYIQEHVDTHGKVYLLGGTGVIPYSFSQKLIRMGFDIQNIHQLGGKDRNETSLIISKQLRNPGNEVVLVTDSDFADALTVASTAVVGNTPILLVSDNGLTPDQKAFCDLQSAVVILGQLAPKVNEIYSQAIALSGANKYDTNGMWTKTQQNRPVLALSTGEDYPDALAGAVLAGSLGGTIVLTRPDQLPSEIVEALNFTSYYNKQPLTLTTPQGQTFSLPAINYPTLYILGGKGAVSESVQAQAAAILNGPGSAE